MFRRAEHIFVISEGMSKVLREKRPELKQTPLVHGFNEAIPMFAAPPPVGSPMQLVFCGNLVSCSDAATRMAKAIAATPSGQVLSIVSGEPSERLRELGLILPGTTLETLPRDKIPGRLRQADVVLLPHIFAYPEAGADEYRTIFPTKTIEYLISGRPILAHGPAGSFLTRFLVENECALVVDEPDIGTVHAIERLRGDSELRSTLVRNASRTAEQFQAATAWLPSFANGSANHPHRLWRPSLLPWRNMASEAASTLDVSVGLRVARPAR